MRVTNLLRTIVFTVTSIVGCDEENFSSPEDLSLIQPKLNNEAVNSQFSIFN